jgi:hypothetical protein
MYWLYSRPMQTTLDWLVDWYRAHLDGEDMLAVTRKQIADYDALSPSEHG